MTVLPHPDSRRHTEFQGDNALSWLQEGSCGAADPELFFPARGELAKAARAKRICAGCPSLAACGEWIAGQPGRVEGIWAGLTERDRRGLTTRQQLQAVQRTRAVAMRGRGMSAQQIADVLGVSSRQASRLTAGAA